MVAKAMSNVFFITDDNDLLWLYGVVVKYNTAKVWKNFVSPNFFEKNFKESQFFLPRNITQYNKIKEVFFIHKRVVIPLGLRNLSGVTGELYRLLYGQEFVCIGGQYIQSG